MQEQPDPGWRIRALLVRSPETLQQPWDLGGPGMRNPLALRGHLCGKEGSGLLAGAEKAPQPFRLACTTPNTWRDPEVPIQSEIPVPPQ